MRLNFYVAPLLAILCATAQATPDPDSAQLRVEGAITQPNYQQDALWDTAMLDQLPEYEIKTHTPWYDEEKTFRGPRLSDLLAKVGQRQAADHHGAQRLLDPGAHQRCRPVSGDPGPQHRWQAALGA